MCWITLNESQQNIIIHIAIARKVFMYIIYVGYDEYQIVMLTALIISECIISKNKELNTLEYWKLPKKHEKAIKLPLIL